MPVSKSRRVSRSTRRAVTAKPRKAALKTTGASRQATSNLRQAQRPAGGRPKLFPGRTGGR